MESQNGQNSLSSQNSVIIKGVRDGLLFILDDDVPFPQVLTELSARLNATPDFFRGATVTINAGRRVMDRPDFDVVYGMLTRNAMRVIAFVSLSAQSRMVAEGYGVPSRPPSFAGGNPEGRGQKAEASSERRVSPSMPGAGEGLFLRSDLHEGQSVRYSGDVCLLGDIEVGAEVVADGSIVVWGALLGTAHAGANGDEEAVVCALRLSPQQLAIAGYITRFPPDEPDAPGSLPPEMAKLEAGRIVVEAWSRA